MATHEIKSDTKAEFVEITTNRFGMLRFKAGYKGSDGKFCPVAEYAKEISQKHGEEFAAADVRKLAGFREEKTKGLSLCLEPLPQKPPKSSSTK